MGYLTKAIAVSLALFASALVLSLAVRFVWIEVRNAGGLTLWQLEELQRILGSNEVQTLVADLNKEIFHDPVSPVGGNPDGDVTLVEFFDYNCPYCRAAMPMIKRIVDEDPGVRIVYKEFPILGPGSDFAARAALASRRQGEYETFHRALMSYSGSIGEGSMLKIAEMVGLDVAKLMRDMEEPAIAEAIQRNLRLAGDLRISGTPSFVAGLDVLRGLVDISTLRRFVEDGRAQTDG